VRQTAGADEYLADLYRNAATLVYPSLYEGFGLPPLEAMAQGCPVVSSNTSSMPEVIGDAAEYFDPDQADDISAAIERVVYAPERRNELIHKGHVRSKMFDWATCASETMRLYQTITVAARSRQ
jgi:glycosyltransferase involved in cell wall biosynthesis